MIKKILLSILFLSIVNFVQAQNKKDNLINNMTKEVCIELEKKDFSKIKKEQIEQELGLALLPVITKYEADIKKEYNVDEVMVSKTMETVGRDIGMKLVSVCPSFLKIFLNPTPAETEIPLNKVKKASGTGFALSSNGIIITNNHVVFGAKLIKVRGVKGDFSKSYEAKLLVSDKNNDLAIIQIIEKDFNSLGTIPYTIKNSVASVGSNIFVLGYPLKETMGDEIKLTNGIISSRTGFQNDVTSYQISAPIQPGNSGGPLFDSQGNIIGVVNSKHTNAENASYAVKSSYLMSLIDLLPEIPTLPSINLLSGKSIVQQVEIVKKYIYIIEIEGVLE